MLSKIIKIDLHIHSKASEYKEPKYDDGLSIVNDSTKENIDILLNALIDKGISLFSITDHNRYDYALYKIINLKLKEEKYNNLQVLHGIEFDVVLEENKPETHIIVIFDVRSEKDMKTIQTTINSNLLVDKKDSYTKKDFEDLLRNIALDTILIVHQRCGLDKSKGNHKSLSEGVSDPYQIIQIGYITALEYQKPNVEGIIKNNLKDLDYSIPLITGSDCHDWSVYPFHDKTTSEPKYTTKIKALPTFRGLLLSLTSPETRFNRNETKNTNYISSFKINGKTIALDPGINAIIGENGSGKSTLFNILENKIKPKGYIKSLKEDNNINVEEKELDVNKIAQSELITKFQNSKLFYDDNDLFDEITNTEFDSIYSNFQKILKSTIDLQISKNSSISSLENLFFEFKEELEDRSTLYVSVTVDDLSIRDNPHKERREKIGTILKSLFDELDNEYYSEEEKNIIRQSIIDLITLYKLISKKEETVDIDNKVKNIIINSCNSYTLDIQAISTAEDNEVSDYNSNKSGFANSIIDAVILNSKKSNDVIMPRILAGESSKRANGYVFSKETYYNRVDVIDKFYEIMFTKNYRDILKLKSISTKVELAKAVNGCSDLDKINSIWTDNFNKFCMWAKEERKYIKEENSDDSIGNTLGEMSLVYYKFQTSSENKCDVLMIDQPEDNISNNRISEKLITYLDSVRRNRQLIIVTHNPLLVVNLDVDNVIHLTKTNRLIDIKAGCLEDEENKIIELVAKTLDGGKDMIEKRLKIYG